MSTLSRPSCSLRAATCSPLAAPCCCLRCSLRCPARARPACCAAMASLRVLAFDHEGSRIQSDTWLDDLQLYLLSDSRDSVSLFDDTSGASLTPPATADSATRSQWLTREAAAHLAIRNHLPLAKCQIRLQRCKVLWPSSTALPVSRAVRFCHSRGPRAARGTPRTPFFEGCSPSPLAPSYASAAAADVLGAEDVGAASTSGKHRSSKGKGGRSGGGGSGGGSGGGRGGGGGTYWQSCTSTCAGHSGLVAKKSDALQEFMQWLVVTEQQTKNSVLMLRSDQGGEFLGKQFTDFVNGKGIVHELTCPYTPQQNGMAEHEMRTVVESVRTMLLHMGVQHHWWHLALRQFLVPEQQRGGKLQPKARWGLHLGVLEESKGWELLDIADNRVVTTLDMVFYENISLEVWKSEHRPASGRTPNIPPSNTSTATLPLLAEVREPATEDVEDVPSPFPSSAPRTPPLAADLRGLTPVSASGNEGRSGASPVALAKSIDGGRRDIQQVDVRVNSTPPGEEQAEEVQPMVSAEEPTTGEKSAGKPAEVQLDDEGSAAGNDGGDAEESTDSDVVEVQRGPRQSRRIQRPPDFYVPAAFTTAYDEVDDNLQYDDAEEDEDFPELDHDMHADPEHRWDISTMTVKEALASWKGKAMKAAMEEEIRSLVGMGTWELVERPPGVNIMKNRRMRQCTLRIFLNIVAVLDLNLMQLDMKNAFQQSKLDRVLYMYQPDYFNDGTGRVCKLLKSLYSLKHLPLLWYRALDGVLLGAGWKKSQVDTALYFKVGDDKVTCWVLVYVNDLLAASSSAAMLKELKELLEAAFELREISPVQKYLRLEIIRDRLARKLWLHQQGYADKLRRRFPDEEQTGRTPKTPVSVDAYAELTFDDEEAQECQEEEYRQKVGSLQFAATTTRPDIAFASSKLGSSLTVRSDQHWREVDRCLAYLANTSDTALDFGCGAESLKLVGYVDADDAGDKQHRTSTSGYVFVFGGAAVSWSSQRIKCATLSSTESEYVTATEAGKEGRHLRFLLAEFRQLDTGTLTVLRVDNKSTITVAEGMGLTGNLKHMERRQAWLQHMVKRGKFSLRYIPTAEQPADF
ncbi:unnamed protein product [Closterium sp. NIES-54]